MIVNFSGLLWGMYRLICDKAMQIWLAKGKLHSFLPGSVMRKMFTEWQLLKVEVFAWHSRLLYDWKESVVRAVIVLFQEIQCNLKHGAFTWPLKSTVGVLLSYVTRSHVQCQVSTSFLKSVAGPRTGPEAKPLVWEKKLLWSFVTFCYIESHLYL